MCGVEVFIQQIDALKQARQREINLALSALALADLHDFVARDRLAAKEQAPTVIK